jgi:hypothetical protein
VSFGGHIRGQLARRAPRLEDAAVHANWRLRNRRRALRRRPADPGLERLTGALRRDGVATAAFEQVFAERALFEEADECAQTLAEQAVDHAAAHAGTKDSFLVKLAHGAFPADHPFVRIALHPHVLGIANGYLRLRSTLRALELWHTRPTPGAPVQTQLWHRDADDVMNVKLFVYFSNVTPAAGPLTYAPRTHPRGDRRALPEHDLHRRSTDEQMAVAVPEPDWRVLTGAPGTIVLADTCGYHKQRKPESEERVTLVAHYVSGTPYVPTALQLRGVEPTTLSEDQHYAVFDRPPS